ncbi:hypothetical protein [Bizionia myxarmorum]|uniref:Uncharacterized protein n=1 Tax=Bizionia myxarmorum TaxID=291186 RepID=A0A5D0RC91_9FLAO|nr:hypothetical protein [Bizionia myxarmorum]TYB79290.1 hypothetical protein ES674_05820 [Bizionia myxarmorum]
MKKYVLLFTISLVIMSCKTDKDNKTTTELDETPLTVSEKIAQAYGIENWDTVNEITFSFNVKKDSTLFKRSWKWSPKTNDIYFTSGSDTLNYNRNNMDSTLIRADQAFVNDKFWLLAPYNLVWDSGTTKSEPVQELAPISQKKLNKLTVTYPNDGGYTPGDAYDFFYNDDYLIEEWIYRKGNSAEPTMVSTWENNTDLKGLLMSLSHKKTEDNWELFFTYVSIN